MNYKPFLCDKDFDKKRLSFWLRIQAFSASNKSLALELAQKNRTIAIQAFSATNKKEHFQ